MLTVDRLWECLDYSPETGVFTWKLMLSWRAPIGTVAGSPRPDRRIYIGIDGKRYLAHRLAWFYVHGEWPTEQIDHRDLNPANNAIANLRLATCSQNHGNLRRPSTNTSGFKGIYRHLRWWRAVIVVRGVRHHLGSFQTPEEAHAAYVVAATAFHGEFARAA